MANLDFRDKVQFNEEHILHGNKEAMLGRALLEPFTSMNSGSRKLMYAKELDQVFPLINGEKAICETGYEIRYGNLSSSIEKAESDCVLLAKIPKFGFAPNHHYYAIMGDANRRKLYVKERKSYNHITEAYGYLNNNSGIDSITPGEPVSGGKILSRSTAFDDYGNRKDGINLLSVYQSLDDNYEDSIIILDEAAEKFTSPLIHTVTCNIADNHIPINWYGNDSVYKVMPDIGETLKDCILSVFRTEIKDECLYNQTKERLTKIMMSDEKKIVRGEDLRVVDIDIYSNNPDNLKNSPYYAQYNMYYQEQLRCANDIVDYVSKWIGQGYTLSRDLQKLYYNSKRFLQGDKYMDKRLFTNLIVNIVVLEERRLNIGDKLADRNGGKGVVSHIWPREKMPVLEDGTPVQCVINSPTMYNRENPAQSIEVSITHVGRCLINKIIDEQMPIEEAANQVLKYVSLVVPEQAKAMESYIRKLSKQDLAFYIESIIQDMHIDISSKPISESYDIDRLNELYKAFPDITQVPLYVPLEDSNGNYRRVRTRRPTIAGYRYTLRLKQFSEEKFSATSLSSTNLRNENVKSKAANNYNAAHSSTCVRIGSQEAGDLAHMGTEYVVNNLMLHSSSPHGRRLTKAMNTEDPYNVDIKLYKDCNSRFAEIAQTYLKTIGLRFNFMKVVKQKLQAAKMHCVNFIKGFGGKEEAVSFNEQPNHDAWESYKERYYRSQGIREDGKKEAVAFRPVRFLQKLTSNDKKDKTEK